MLNKRPKLEHQIFAIRKSLEMGSESYFPEYYCDYASRFTVLVLGRKYPNIELKVANFRHFGQHCFNVIGEKIIDLTIDQFGNYRPGIIDEDFFSRNYKKINDYDKEIGTGIDTVKEIINLNPLVIKDLCPYIKSFKTM